MLQIGILLIAVAFSNAASAERHCTKFPYLISDKQTVSMNFELIMLLLIPRTSAGCFQVLLGLPVW